PNVVQVYDAGEFGNLAFLAMELVEGGSLADRLRRTGAPLPAHEAAQLVETLARAVHYLHRRGIIHRSMSPGNMLLTTEGVPKIADVGLAKRVGPDAPQGAYSEEGAVIGIPSYMAPEQAAGKGHRTGPPADIYALGAILYELLTGRPPFKAPTAMDTLLQV